MRKFTSEEMKESASKPLFDENLILNKDASLPKVSIITPSYNKGRFIAETILSVQKQSYRNIEHIIVDGGSTDETLSILRKYNGLVSWISEPDEGQSHAINKGLSMAQGEIIGYVNADDTLVPDAVEVAVKYLLDYPDIAMVYGDCNIIDEKGSRIGLLKALQYSFHKLVHVDGWHLPPAIFFWGHIMTEVGNFDINLHYAMDYDFYVRVANKFRVHRLSYVLSNYRTYPDTKTTSDGLKMLKEGIRISLKYGAKHTDLIYIRYLVRRVLLFFVPVKRCFLQIWLRLK